MKYSRILTIFVFIFLFNHIALAQSEDLHKLVTPTTGVIAGSLADEYGKPIPYASIFVMNAKDSMTTAYGITNEAGRFTIAEIPYGKSILKIEYVGYSTIYTSPFI